MNWQGWALALDLYIDDILKSPLRHLNRALGILFREETRVCWCNEPRCKVSKQIWPYISHCNIRSRKSKRDNSNTAGCVMMWKRIKRLNTFNATVLLCQRNDNELWGIFDLGLERQTRIPLSFITSQRCLT